MNRILYLKQVWGYKKGVGLVLIIKGFYSLFATDIFFGALYLILGLVFVSTEGAEINLENKTYRLVRSIFGMNFGKWQECPKFEYISVFRTNENQTAKLPKNIILINLFYSGNKHITFYKTKDKNEAFDVAERIKNVFKIDILDATENEKKWLKESTTTNSYNGFGQ
jgi:hypothetical protein